MSVNNHIFVEQCYSTELGSVLVAVVTRNTKTINKGAYELCFNDSL